MRFGLLRIVGIGLTFVAAIAHADTVTTFKLSHGSDVFEFSIAGSTMPLYTHPNQEFDFMYLSR